MVAYRAEWAAEFERERVRVAAVLAPWAVGAVEHIGSTAVPGLVAKPIIDMMVSITDHRDGAAVGAALAGVGWVHAPEPGDADRCKMSFCFPDPQWRSHHLHVYQVGDPIPRTLLRFRDHLQAHPEDAAEYGRIKTALATADEHDRPRYRAGKAPFIQSVLARATRGPGST
ncbi:GrpB family protein [Actinoplanes sichuanensis]|uniref:GrpB family protein n=1 Tax=Actinoplanes sichuanensis TaxID=512349 RepID=A0ABW4A4B9_9ACTN|nr:GrpB family protein [Actinoplanes sichuanensis]BEL03117.1 GrpB family protein [Actinoplanes sichuanensis]